MTAMDVFGFATIAVMLVVSGWVAWYGRDAWVRGWHSPRAVYGWLGASFLAFGALLAALVVMRSIGVEVLS